tara:strand:+ start:354 stop:515 length:162 start_codon:yes stop_codon:yes gene_type:complete
MPVYKDTANNRKLNRVGKVWGKSTDKKKVPKGSHKMPDGTIMKDSDMKKKTGY